MTAKDTFSYTEERFADIQMLRYRLDDFDKLTLRQKQYIYCLTEATLWGRDITFDQFGRYNLRIRRVLEAILCSDNINKATYDFQEMEIYLKRVWFSNGIHHHYGMEKFQPAFSREWFVNAVKALPLDCLPLKEGETPQEFIETLTDVLFNPDVMPKRVNKADGVDLVLTSACNYYVDVTQQEAEEYYALKKKPNDIEPLSYGLNSRLKKDANECLFEEIWCEKGVYGDIIKHITEWLERACEFAENDEQESVIRLLIDYYRTGDLQKFDAYSIAWLKATDGVVDFINGFIEVYGDPLGLKASWEGIVEYKDMDATRRTKLISDNAQWFEDHSPIDPRFRKTQVRGVSATVVRAAMLGGDEYPSTAIGINLPNADWIRAKHGSKSVTISNITDAYNKAARGNGLKEEFVVNDKIRSMIDAYSDICDDLHTDLHECLGHGSGQLLPSVDSDALKAYASTIEEARADLFGLYYMADKKLVELGLLPDEEAYKAQYYTYMMNGLMTQLVRIQPGNIIEEAHMRNRALIARWCLKHGNAVEMIKREGKTYVEIKDYEALRQLFATLLAEIQRIKSEGDIEAARHLVEAYAVNIDASLHAEVLERYARLNIAPYKGFINPKLSLVRDADGMIADVAVDYTETYSEQMLRYGKDYSVECCKKGDGIRSNDKPDECSNALEQRVKAIKRSFRMMMNGITSQSMREKGSCYHVNWGASLPMLKEKAQEIGKDYALACALWRENVRECKILAILIMPVDEMTSEQAEEWIAQTTTQELVELSAFYLYSHMSNAQELALKWIKIDDNNRRLCGLNMLARLFAERSRSTESMAFTPTFIDEIQSVLKKSSEDTSLSIRKAAYSCALHLSSIVGYENIVDIE